MSSESKTTARCCRLVISITWRGTVCKTVSSQNLLTDAWTAAQFANWHQVREAPQQIVTCIICWFLGMQQTLHSPFSNPRAKRQTEDFSGNNRITLDFTPFHPLLGCPPQQTPSSERFTAPGRLFPMCSGPNLCAGKQSQPSCCPSTASPGLLCLAGPKVLNQH